MAKPKRKSKTRSQRFRDYEAVDSSERRRKRYEGEPPHGRRPGEDAPIERRMDREERVRRLKDRVRSVSGGELVECWADEDCPLDLQEEFWESVLAWESAPDTTHAKQLNQRGVYYEPTDSKSDSEIANALWALVRELASMNVFLTHTDHLSDSELYEKLWRNDLQQPTKTLPKASLWQCEIDLLGGCTREELILLRTFYSDEWLLGPWDESTMGPEPDPRSTPYDRDRRLPRGMGTF